MSQSPTKSGKNAENLENTEALRQAVIDADEMHRRVHAMHHQSNSSSCSKRRQDSTRLAQKTLEQLSEFERNLNMAGSRRFSHTKFFNDAKLLVEADQLVNAANSSSSAEGFARLQKSVQRLVDVHASSVHQQQSSGQTEAEMTTNVAGNFYATHRFLNDRAPELIGKCINVINTNSSALQSELWSSIPDALLVLLDDVTTTMPTTAVLDGHEESRKRIDFNVEELSHQQGDAIADGDMKAAEELYFKKVTVQESMVPLYEEMMGILDEHQQAAVMEPATRATEVHSRANSEISAIASKNESRKRDLQTDLRALSALQKQVTDEDRDLRQRFVRVRGDSDQFLKDNLGETERCYKAMEELERHVARLASERSEAVARRLAADIQEQQRVCDLENFLNFSKNHRALLETSIRDVDASDEVTDLFHELVSSGTNAIGQRIRCIEQEIEAARIALHEKRLNQFRNLYLTLGDLQYKKERNLEELDKRIEQVHIQQEIAMDTFNPKAKDLANAKKELLAVRDEMASQINVISDKAVLQIESFKPTEQALTEAGKQFTHPVDELNAKNEQRQQKLLAYHQLMDENTSEDAKVGGAPMNEELQAIEDLK